MTTAPGSAAPAPATQQPAVSVVIPTRNRPDVLQEALQHLLRQTVCPDEVVVIDDSTDERTSTMLAAFTRQSLPFRFIHHRPAQPVFSLTRSRNLGIGLARGAFILFIDDDTLVQPDFIAQMAGTLQALGPDYAGGSAMWTDDPAFRPLRIPSQRFKRFFCMGHYGHGGFLPNGMPRHPLEQHRLVDTAMVEGYAMIFRREICERYLFDPALNGYCVLEDTDFGFRVSREHRLFFNPAALVYHRALHTTQLARRDHARMFVSNYLYHFRKNVRKTPLAFAALIWSFVGLFLRALLNRVLSEITGYLLGFSDALRYGIRPGPASYRCPAGRASSTIVSSCKNP